MSQKNIPSSIQKSSPVDNKISSPSSRPMPVSLKKGRLFPLALVASVIALLVIVVTVILSNEPGKSASSSGNIDANAQLNAKGDLVIQISSVSDQASFYPLTINGTQMEVLAVKAPDGSIRTAFNTCQVCYSSGRGYYKQEGDALVCQNCGNRFKMNQVEVVNGGCNPVPITEENKTADATNITISGEYLKQATQIFQNWKTA